MNKSLGNAAGRRTAADRKAALDRIRNSFFMRAGDSISRLIIEGRDGGDDEKDERKHA